MEVVTKESIKKLIIFSLQELIFNDSDIFSTGEGVNNQQNEQRLTNNRLVHETATNHRFAIYLEQNLSKILCSARYYQVDIEYNRYFGRPKGLNGVTITPDILIHKRQGDNLKVDNLLIVEAKKVTKSDSDEARVEAMMKDPKYLFQYGLVVTYCYDHDSKIKCKFYYKEKGRVRCEEFFLPKSH